MNKSKKIKNYMRHVYSKDWHIKRIEYGLTDYDESIINLVKETESNLLLEVGVGDGEPYAKHFFEQGFQIYGIDISDSLINIAKNNLPNIDFKVGDAENIDFNDYFFDATYCFRSTWYFPNLLKAVNEMIRVTKKGGFVIFDLQNKNNIIHIKAIKRRKLKKNLFVLTIGLKFLKNVINIISNKNSYKNYDWSLNYVIYENPTNISELLNSLNKIKRIKKIEIFGANSLDKTSIKSIHLDKINDFDRIILRIKL